MSLSENSFTSAGAAVFFVVLFFVVFAVGLVVCFGPVFGSFVSGVALSSLCVVFFLVGKGDGFATAQKTRQFKTNVSHSIEMKK